MSDRRQADLSLYVAKSNELIRNTKYTLALQAQQVIDFALTRIKPDDLPGKWYSFEIQDFCHSHGISDDSGKTYTDIKETCKQLRDRSWWIKTEDGSYTTVAWFQKVKCEKNSGIIEYQFDPDTDKYVIDLIRTGHYTSLPLRDLNVFRSKYSYDLYQIFKSYLGRDYFSRHDDLILYFNADELKEQLYGEDTRFADFNRRVLSVALKELNEKCADFNVECQLIHNGRKVEKVCFVLTYPRYHEIVERRTKTRKQLNRTKKNQKD